MARLETAGLPGLLKAALEADPSRWLGTRLWDDAAALSLVKPQVFAPRGKHLAPAVGEDALRALVVEAINRGWTHEGVLQGKKPPPWPKRQKPYRGRTGTHSPQSVNFE